jgi:hypothetical protein
MDSTLHLENQPLLKHQSFKRRSFVVDVTKRQKSAKRRFSNKICTNELILTIEKLAAIKASERRLSSLCFPEHEVRKGAKVTLFMKV